jgi:hypothetical protein
LGDSKLVEEVVAEIRDVCGNKVVALPENRVFTIGGSLDI